MRDVAGKIALVTGGALGMGRQWCRHLAGDGARVAIWDINADASATLAEELRGRGAEVYTDRVDVSRREEIASGAERLRRNSGIPEILINNAGIVSAAPFADADDSKLSATIDINVKAVMFTCKEFLPDMMKRNCGHIVNVASAAGYIGVPYMPAYTASKWAVIGLTESLRLEMKLMRRTGIEWTLFCPSYVGTGMFDGARAPLLTPILSPEEAVRRAYRGFKRGAYLVREPFMVKITPVLRTLLPTAAFDWVSDHFGVTASMVDWRGHEGIDTHTS